MDAKRRKAAEWKEMEKKKWKRFLIAHFHIKTSIKSKSILYHTLLLRENDSVVTL